jgi:DNA-binding NtrC family response regulator
VTARAADPSLPAGSKASGTILVVEDEEALLKLTAERLEESGYEVLQARDGIHALEIARSFEGSIHLLLTDVMMPRMGGLTLARNFSELRPDTRIVFMSGHAPRDTSNREAMRCGSGAIQKPFSHDQLMEAVRAALDAVLLAVQS